ncbi:MAG: hypothetical protein ABR910_12135 [Acidobacteriaceae bacterium]|jgi:hypothetical protein
MGLYIKLSQGGVEVNCAACGIGHRSVIAATNQLFQSFDWTAAAARVFMREIIHSSDLLAPIHRLVTDIPLAAVEPIVYFPAGGGLIR